ncbi:MAG: SDR family NAD(P)-dependent oxidoreductase [Minwuia sp.]|uniref:SDR family NAD(P)-dependent oxidoreductase n=1 Tax=Minwuia sp. TaxID=2493630 RepID=UPI003A876A15
MDLGLKGKIAIVTGGSDGLGRATAHRLAQEGAKVVICGRREDHLKAQAEAISAETGGDVVAVRADVSVAADCENLVKATVEKFGGLDILINNAGASAAASFEDVTDESWQADFELKVMGAVRVTRASLPHLKARGGGSIVNATIGQGKAPPAKALPTSLSRAAGINLTKSLANEYAADNIRVNTICIGLIKSAQWDRRAGDRPVEELHAELGKRVPLGRIGEAEDYGDLAAFLCSERATYITGTAINLDGGVCPVV